VLVAVIVTGATAGSASQIELNAVARSIPQMAAATPRSWRVHLVSIADLEGPPVVVPGTDEAFALHGNDEEEVASEPLERVNLVSGDVAVGPRVPDDALLGVVGAHVVLVAPERYGANGVVARPWRVWTVNPNTLQPERPITLPFVSDFGAVIPEIDFASGSSDIWVSNGAALRLVDLANGKVARTLNIPALDLSVDSSGHRLYVLTGTGGSSTTGSAYRPGTIVELDARTGTIVATSTRWTSSPQLQIAASAAGVYLLDTGRADQSVAFLDDRGLRSVDLPAALESTLSTSVQSGDDLTTAPIDDGVVIGSVGRLTCVAPGATSARASTALAPGSISWAVFAQRAGTLFAWNLPSTEESSRIEAITAPSHC
jgi:hypothetical protein